MPREQTFLDLFSQQINRFSISFTKLPKFSKAVSSFYSIILLTTPAPTVRPPSRIAKRRPSSIATGWISSTLIFTLSPGITISTPSGSWQEPVTSVVRK